MGKKVNPLIFRISNIKNPSHGWYSKWFAKKAHYAAFVEEDTAVRKLIKKQVGDVGLDKIIIQRSGKGEVEVILRVSKPGVIIGRGGEKSEKLKKEIKKIVDKNSSVKLTIKEIPKPNLSADSSTKMVALETSTPTSTTVVETKI